jgi:hypothetical protein
VRGLPPRAAVLARAQEDREASSLALLVRDLQALLPPQPMHPRFLLTGQPSRLSIAHTRL